MKQAPFEAAHAREWSEFEAFLENKPAFDPAEMPARFRRLCQSLALAAERRYSADLVDRLNRLALRGHHALYVNRRRESQQVLGFLLAGFPRLVRQEWRLVAAAAALAAGPSVLVLDEPSAGLDDDDAQRLTEVIRTAAQQGVAVLVADSDVHFVLDRCERIVVLERGRVVAEGRPAVIGVHPAVVRAYLGEAA
jgi:ABC-type uncharacterized transport system ATPase subunit